MAYRTRGRRYSRRGSAGRRRISVRRGRRRIPRRMRSSSRSRTPGSALKIGYRL
jgi:hypothetical protein